MSATPPPGYGIWAISISTTGSGHTSVVTCGFQNNNPYTASQSNSQLRSAMNATSSPWLSLGIATGFNVISTYVLINTGAGLYVDTNVTTINGARAGSPPSINVAEVVQKRTIYAGRQFRGRMFVPPFGVDEADISIAGVISTATARSVKWTAFYNALVTNNIPPYLIHDAPKSGVTPPPTPITGFATTQLIGSIKRRIRP